MIHKNDNYEIYAFTWDDVFKSFDLRHSFMLDKLNVDRDKLLEDITKENSSQSRTTVEHLAEVATQN